MPSNVDPGWQIFGVLIAYSAAVILASVLGGLLPEWIRLTHNRMQLMISFVGGIMLGIAVFHMIPHALVATDGDSNRVAWGLMLGLLATFFLLRSFHFHQHGPADFGILAEEQKNQQAAHEHAAHAEPVSPTHICSDHNHPASHDYGSESTHAKRWIAVLVGLGLHTLMDGVAMASGVITEVMHGQEVWLPGFGIFLAVLLHKPLDAVSITSLMHPVTTPAKRLMVNVGFAMMCPVGAFLFWSGASLNSGWSQNLAGFGLAFSAGVFLCISLSDLLPEMEFHSHNRIPLSLALLAGILAALAIGLLEDEHAHSHSPSPNFESSHDHPESQSPAKPIDPHAGHTH